jgi:ABC-2 type transport system permease protein
MTSAIAAPAEPTAAPGTGWRVWWLRMRVMTWKELLQLGRDPILLGLVLYAFTGDVYNAGSGVTLQLKQATMAVQDHDHSPASRELVSRFMPPYFRLLGEVGSDEQGLRLLEQGTAMLVLDVPPGFQAQLLRGEQASVQLQVDATNSVLGFLAYSDGAQIVGRYGLEVGLARSGLSASAVNEAPVVVNATRVWFNANQNDAWFMAISEMLNVITVFAIMLPCAAMVREKERGTVEQLLVSPLTPLQVMLPKVVAMTAVILLATALCIATILVPVFHVPIKGSLWLFFAITTLYVGTIAGLGLFIATVTRNLAQASMLAILILAPLMFLSGVWTPPEALPTVVRWGMYLSPLYYYIDASYGVLLKGAGLDLLWDSVLGIAVLGSAVFGLGLWQFRRQFG